MSADTNGQRYYRARTLEEKRELARELKVIRPDVLEDLTLIGTVFGKLDEIELLVVGVADDE